ncbi:MAG: hypothetical protein KIT20_06740 [Alphaproteobacteria bacterium]|nr:hypothetical protein [Alphaproteobacteria bacterium]
MKAPVSYSEALGETICALLAEGHSLRAICARQDMPCMRSVMRWLAGDAAFRRLYGAARLLQADRLADEILAIADEREGDHRIDEKGRVVTQADAIQRAKLRVDTRKWLMSRMSPRKYGDALAEGGAGEDGELIIQVVRYDDHPAAQ